MDSKLNEANDFIAKAEKSLSKSFFKRTPDYDSAIEYYTKAALIFRNAKCLEKAAALYKTIADLHYQLGSYFHCAKNYENASLVYRDLKQYDQMAELVAHSGELMRKCGAPDSAAYLYERAAKNLETPNPQRAAEFYESAADACEVEDKFHEAADQCNYAARIWVRLRRFSDAERMLRLYIAYLMRGNPDSVAANVSGLADHAAVPKMCARAVVTLVLIKLHEGDEVAANKVFSEAMECWRFGESDDYPQIRQLLGALEDGDASRAEQILKSSCFKTLDLDYARLLKEIKLPEVVEPFSDAPLEKTHPPSNAIHNEAYKPSEPETTFGEDGEDESEDIC